MHLTITLLALLLAHIHCVPKKRKKLCPSFHNLISVFFLICLYCTMETYSLICYIVFHFVTPTSIQHILCYGYNSISQIHMLTFTIAFVINLSPLHYFTVVFQFFSNNFTQWLLHFVLWFSVSHFYELLCFQNFYKLCVLTLLSWWRKQSTTSYWEVRSHCLWDKSGCEECE